MAVGCACLGLGVLLLNRVSPFAVTDRGVLAHWLPRTILYLIWAGEAVAALVGMASFALIRRQDIVANAVAGIVVRSLFGIAVGVWGTVYMWLIVGHVVIGF